LSTSVNPKFTNLPTKSEEFHSTNVSPNNSNLNNK
jgi:hypothetical protein